MAGTVAVAADKRWSATGWLFDWVLEAIATDLGDTPVTARIREIVDENLGWLGVDTLPEPERTRVFDTLAALPARAQTQLPETVPERDTVVRYLHDLAALAAAAR
jgi:hypothetical protein